LAARRQKNEWNRGERPPAAQLLHERDTVHFRHVNIADDQIRRFIGSHFEANSAVLGLHDGVACRRERQRERSSDAGVVLHDQNLFLHG
jgi:hypothetical protein